MKKKIVFLAFALGLFCFRANAQIVYTDIQPDGLPANGGFDFNGDGINEFTITTMDVSGDYFDYSASPQGTNIWANGDQNNGWDVPKPLSAGQVIDSNGNFIGFGDASMTAWGAGTPFPQDSARYIGIRIIVAGQPHYGWIRVEWNGSDFIYKDFAYETTANKAIEAGEMPSASGVEKLNGQQHFVVYPSPAHNKLVVEMRNVVTAASVINFQLVDAAGRVISVVPMKHRTKIIINISGLSKGIYYVKFFDKKQQIGIKKFVVA